MLSDKPLGRGGATKEQVREAFLRHRVEPREGHLIWLGKTSALSGQPIGFFQGGDKAVPGYVVAYKVLRGQDVSNRVRTCDVALCVHPDHWRKADAEPRKTSRARTPRRSRAAEPATTCPHGHSRAEFYRKLPCGRSYCAKCSAQKDSLRVKSACKYSHPWPENRRVNDNGYAFCAACKPHLAQRVAVKGNCQRGYGPHALAETGYTNSGGQTKCEECHPRFRETCSAGHDLSVTRVMKASGYRCGICYDETKKRSNERRKSNA